MADRTTLAESSQALFCAIADKLGAQNSQKFLDIKKYEDYAAFTGLPGTKSLIAASYKRIRVASKGSPITLSQINKFLDENPDWYKSSVLIAKKLIKNINKIDPDYNIKAADFQSLYYFRGDEEVMGNIEKLFKIANKSPITKVPGQIKFGNVNKWSPADMYLASKYSKKQINSQLLEATKESKTYTFGNLNELVNNLIDSGNLLPLSLKKKTTEDVILERVNFDKKAELKKIRDVSISPQGVTDWKPYKQVPFGEKSETRDIRVFLNNNGEVKFRHDPSAKRFVAEFIGKGAEARAGSIGSIKVFCELMAFVDKTTAKKLLKAYQEGEKEYFKLLPEIQELRKDKKRFDFERGAISAITIINRIMPILKNWFTRKHPRDKKEIDIFVKILYSYITSRSPLSGKFVIAK